MYVYVGGCNLIGKYTRLCPEKKKEHKQQCAYECLQYCDLYVYTVVRFSLLLTKCNHVRQYPTAKICCNTYPFPPMSIKVENVNDSQILPAKDQEREGFTTSWFEECGSTH